MNKIDWLGILLALAGAWLFICPWVVGSIANGPTGFDAVYWNFGLTGFTVAMFAYGALLSYWKAERFIVLVGSWLVASPWLLQYADSQAATWNAVGMGMLLIVLAIARTWARKVKR
ncbi:MAG: SPW repeat protein [Phyllobacterium sp.]|uniref:SPW repeat protein n=1 Tax=Phyllobacterium sp. TaxID=1871046 RepID=UPI0030F207DB